MKKTTANKTEDVTRFKHALREYKTAIDADIETYSTHVEQVTLQQYGTYARVEIDAFLAILARGGKRIRGALVMAGYEMSGGTDRDMILQVARAVEMMHAYILMVDDIQDRSSTRRGGLAAHKLLADYHTTHELAGDADHFGMSIALNAALAGAHTAQMILANIDAPEALRIKVLSIINRTMTITAHGQTNDIMNEVVAHVSADDIERVLEWKTAHYTFLNPLHVGMVLAGADCHATDAITDYAMHTGKAFQITDDILGIFGSEHESGKSPMDDMREGKHTVLTAYVLEHADKTDKNFLIQMLGKQTITPAEFASCKKTFEECGALDHAQTVAKDHVAAALKSLQENESRWSNDGVQFLRGLATYVLARTS